LSTLVATESRADTQAVIIIPFREQGQNKKYSHKAERHEKTKQDGAARQRRQIR